MSYDINKMLDIAKKEVGYLEKKTNSNLYNKTDNAGYKNYTKYAYEIDTKYPTFYNGKKNGYDWCDIFVDWLFITAYGESAAKALLCQPVKSCGAGCGYSANYYKTKKQFHTVPNVGDQIFFKSSQGSIYHTGIVYKVDDTYVYTIEGNTSSESGVVANGGAVAEKKYKRNYNCIYGYGRPNYGDQSEFNKTTNNTTTTNTNTTNTTISLDNGTKLTLSKVALYANSASKTKAGTVTGTYYVWDKTVINNRIRITNNKANVGNPRQVTGFIDVSAINAATPSAPTVSTTPSASNTYNVKVTAKAGLNVRKKANVLSQKITALKYGTVVTISKTSGNWGYVASKGGWISLAYTSKV